MRSSNRIDPQALLAHNATHMRTYQSQPLHIHSKRRILTPCVPLINSRVFRAAPPLGRLVPDRRPLLDVFRTRLESLIDDAGLSRVAYAGQIGVDRSTLSQLLSESNRRLPRVETLARIARASNVSVDWLLGLTHQGPQRTELMKEEASIEKDATSSDDARLIRWHAEAVGYKIRYVPATLPELLKTEEVIRHETTFFDTATPEQRIDTASSRLEWQRMPETDMEACNSVQAVEGFALGEGIWRTLSVTRRRAQLDKMLELTDELYPTFRWFLYDGRQRYAAPVTVFGNQRAAFYLGQMYLVVHGDEQIKAITQNFDQLIRAAVVQPPDVPKLLRRLRSQL